MLHVVARIVRAAGAVAGGFLVVGALLYVLEANTGNWLVGTVMDVSRWFASPVRGIFDLDENKAQVVINWGIGAGLYVVLGMVVAAGIERLAARSERDDSSSSRAREA